MNAALFRKTVYDHRAATLIAAAAMTLFPVLLINAFASIPWEMTQEWLKIPWIARLIRALTGADLSEVLTINTLGAFAFVHPIALVVPWATVVMITTRVICGEIDQGTADLLLALPVSRWSVYASVSAWAFVCCPLLMLCLWCGIGIGDRTTDMDQPIRLWELRYVAVNACFMHAAVAGIGMLFSAAGSRRGRAVGWVFGILVASFLLNSLSAFWPRARTLSVLGILHYFRPFAILRDGRFETGDIVVLLLIAVTTWLVGGLLFARRDIHAS